MEDSPVKNTDDTGNDDNVHTYYEPEDDVDYDNLGIWEQQAVRCSNSPCTFFWTSLVSTLVLSFLGMYLGNFTVEVEGAGWLSRRTLISDRHTQFVLVDMNNLELFHEYNGGVADENSVWYDLTNNVQGGWEIEEDEERRRLDAVPSQKSMPQRRLPVRLDEMKRNLQIALDIGAFDTGVLEGCNIAWYFASMMQETRVWPVWKTKNVEEHKTFLRGDLILDLCQSEEKTQKFLFENDFCETCGGERCLPPYSLVLYARSIVPNGLNLDCEELTQAWETYNEENTDFEQQLVDCAEALSVSFDAVSLNFPSECPGFLYPFLVNDGFKTSSQVRYTSSVFATKSDYGNIEAMYEKLDEFDRGSDRIEGAFDTQHEDFLNLFVEGALLTDMGLALASAIVTTSAILIHTKSCFMTIVGFLQITLSFPLSFFVYKLILGLEFFPFLNFIGVFVVFAIGADDMFVAVDKWKNARLEYGNSASVQKIAVAALPDAAGAMFLTTVTTAVAFFGTALCPVAPIKCFSIFCGLLIVLDYFMVIILVFPALCIYDSYRAVRSCCFRCNCCAKDLDDDNDDAREDPEEKKVSLIRRLLTGFYDILHMGRYPLLVLCIVALVLSTIFAASMELPTSSDVRILNDDVEFEKNYLWRQQLLSTSIRKKEGAAAYFMWGTSPADTGDHTNPDSFSTLVLNDKFDPSKTDAQAYLLEFCPTLFKTEFASPVDARAIDEYCYMSAFNNWLVEQSSSDNPDPMYVDTCNGASGIPMAEEDFDACIINWSQYWSETRILARNGKVQILLLEFKGRVRFDSPFDELDAEWNLIEDWTKKENSVAPESVKGFYFTSEDFWWYDTNGKMLNTAIVAAAIAIATGAAVILFSSRSFVLTLFSSLTIGYVLTSVTACLVSFGWSLGFLEAICFAILIGLSCDFVIHFAHAYSSLPGDVNRGERTKFALIMMGPSILAAGVTTIAAAIVMLFTVITFFQKFGIILFVTVIQAVLGSFVVFLVLTDCFGPSRPTYLIDKLMGQADDGETNVGEAHPSADEKENDI